MAPVRRGASQGQQHQGPSHLRGEPLHAYRRSGFGRVHKSTDGGATWSELELGLRGTEDIYSLEIDPYDPQTLLAATKQGLRKSTNAGATWNSAGAGLGDYLCMGLAFHPARKGTVYAGTAGTGFFKSIDGGETFEPLGKGMAAGWTEKVYAPASGMGPIFAQLSVGLFRMDGPASWTEIQAPFSPGEPAKIDGIVFDRDSPKRVYAHNASYWWRSDDAGRAWSKVEVPRAEHEGTCSRGSSATPSSRASSRTPPTRRSSTRVRGRTATPARPSSRRPMAARSGNRRGPGSRAEA